MRLVDKTESPERVDPDKEKIIRLYLNHANTRDRQFAEMIHELTGMAESTIIIEIITAGMMYNMKSHIKSILSLCKNKSSDEFTRSLDEALREYFEEIRKSLK